ncbi:Uncharacterised protein [Vibrio cholerae]|nr:Uncharacterised protein [Vibrio cholerae]
MPFGNAILITLRLPFLMTSLETFSLTLFKALLIAFCLPRLKALLLSGSADQCNLFFTEFVLDDLLRFVKVWDPARIVIKRSLFSRFVTFRTVIRQPPTLRCDRRIICTRANKTTLSFTRHCDPQSCSKFCLTFIKIMHRRK